MSNDASIPKVIEVACLRQANEAPDQNGLYPKELKMRVGGKRTKPLSIEVLCDWAERAQPTSTQLQRRRVYLIELHDPSQHPESVQGDRYNEAFLMSDVSRFRHDFKKKE